MDFLKGIGGKIAGGVVGLLVVAGGISWWRMEAGEREAVLGVAGRAGAWVLIVLLGPWALFWVVGWVARFERNSAGALLVIGLTGVEMAGLGWMFDWRWGGGGMGWGFVVAGALLAGVYNLFACDWIAERLE